MYQRHQTHPKGKKKKTHLMIHLKKQKQKQKNKHPVVNLYNENTFWDLHLKVH